MLKYRKTALWIAVAVIIAGGALIACLLSGPKENEHTLTLRIVDGAENGNLVLAGEEASEVYTLDVKAHRVQVNLDGNSCDASALEDGMMAEISYGGTIETTYPANIGEVKSISVYSLGEEKNPGGSFYDLCGLYLEVLNDLWEKDSGLNSGAAYVSVDLSQAPGELTEGEKSAVAWSFARAHDVHGLNLSFDELKEQGYLTEVNTGGESEKAPLYQWDNGVLFSIAADDWDEDEIYSLPVVKFTAGKWRSPLGAYIFSDCTATWPARGSWRSYSIGAEAIS